VQGIRADVDGGQADHYGASWVSTIIGLSPNYMSRPRPRHQLLRNKLARFTRTLPGVEVGQPGAVHKARVASRRLRELMPLLQIEAHEANRLSRGLRKATRRLGALRELDVMLDSVKEQRGRHPERALDTVFDAIERRREKAWKKFRGVDTVEDLRRLGKKLNKVQRRLAEEPGSRAVSRAWRWAIDARVARRSTTLKAAIEKAGAMYVAERLHGVRIAVKKLRYAVELRDEAAGGSATADAKTLKRIQGLLGRLHDQQVHLDYIRRVQASIDVPDLILWQQLDDLIMDLEAGCRRLHARYVRERDDLLGLCGRLAARGAPATRALARAAG
jgi:CHAD domain-containing protein